MQIWAESGKSALPICNYSQILYQFLTFTQNLRRSLFASATAPFLLSRYLHEHKQVKISCCFLLSNPLYKFNIITLSFTKIFYYFSITIF